MGVTGFENEKFCIQLFQKRQGPRWCIDDYSKFKSWYDLTTLFLRHYNFNNEANPDELELQRTIRSPSKPFRECTQRWRKLTARFKPSLDEKELVSTLIHALSDFYYGNLFTFVGKPFSDLIRHVELLDDGIKSGRIRTPKGQPSMNNRGCDNLSPISLLCLQSSQVKAQ